MATATPAPSSPTLTSDESWTLLIDKLQGLVVDVTLDDNSTMTVIVDHHTFTDDNEGWLAISGFMWDENASRGEQGDPVTISLQDITNIDVC